MNIKFFDSILKYFTVVICCAVVGLFVQDIYSKNDPNISGNIVFLIGSGIAFILYAFIVIFLNELVPKLNIQRSFKKEKTFDKQRKNEEKFKDIQLLEKNTKIDNIIIEDDKQSNVEKKPILEGSSQTLDVDTQITEIADSIEDYKQGNVEKKPISEGNSQTLDVDIQNTEIDDSIIEDNKQILDSLNHIPHVLRCNIDNQINFSDNTESTKNKTLRQEQHLNKQINTAIAYIKKELKEYVPEEGDLLKICKSVVLYANKAEIPDNLSIGQINLSKKDLRHFGWNIWNHFGGTDHQHQEKIVIFLTVMFPLKCKIKDIEYIIKHLKENEKAGKIKIKEDLSVIDDTEK